MDKLNNTMVNISGINENLIVGQALLMDSDHSSEKSKLLQDLIFVK